MFSCDFRINEGIGLDMSITAMKQALEALEHIDSEDNDRDFLFPYQCTMLDAAITALRTAIEQAEKQDGDCQQCGGEGCVACDARKQEPVAWGMKSLGGDFIIDCITPEEHAREEGGYNIPLYTTPPAAPVQERNFCERCGKRLGDGHIHTCTPPAIPVQEPVAYVVTTEVHGKMCTFIHRIDLTKLLPDGALLYTTSPSAQRQWVGLTEEEHTQIAVDAGCMSSDWVFYGAAVERALKEKNK